MNWIRKHKKSLWVAFGAAGLGYVCYRCVKAHYAIIQEREAQLPLLERAELQAESQLQSHFQLVQQIADNSALATVLPHLKNQLQEQIDLSDITEKLFQGKDSPQVLSGKMKLELWEILKILSFCQAFSSICSLTLMVLLIRVQMNILARHVYIDTARNISIIGPTEQAEGLTTAFQWSYLAFAEFLPYEGIRRLIRDINRAVEEVLGVKTLRDLCNIGELGQIFESISRSFQKEEHNWIQYMLPETMKLSNELLTKMLGVDHAGYEEDELQSFQNDERMRSLLAETTAILDSKEFEDVLQVSLAVLIKQVTSDFENMYHEWKTDSIPLAKLIPHVARLAEPCFDKHEDNKYIQSLVKLPQLEKFCAMVYAAGQE